MNRETKLEAAAYLKSRPALMIAAEKFCQKYRSLGHFGGAIKLFDLSERDCDELGAFLRRRIEPRERLTFKEFSRAWRETRFAESDLNEVLLQLMPPGFVTKRQELEQRQTARQNVIAALMRRHESEAASKWLAALTAKEIRLPSGEIYDKKELLESVAAALDNLPLNYCRLPFLATQVTGNPHDFDSETVRGRLFLQALAFLAKEKMPVDAEDKTRLYYRFRILRDDILNFVTVYGLRAWDDSGQEISYWREAAKNFSPLNLPLREIIRVNKLAPYGDYDRIYIVENSGVFSTLLDFLQARRKYVPLALFSGQLKTASWVLLDKISSSGSVIYYSGDLDPEGVIIASRILTRYPDAQPWHMTAAEGATGKVSLPSERWVPLAAASLHPKLMPLVETLQKTQCALYQESLTEKMLQDLADC